MSRSFMFHLLSSVVPTWACLNYKNEAGMCKKAGSRRRCYFPVNVEKMALKWCADAAWLKWSFFAADDDGRRMHCRKKRKIWQRQSEDSSDTERDVSGFVLWVRPRRSSGALSATTPGHFCPRPAQISGLHSYSEAASAPVFSIDS